MKDFILFLRRSNYYLKGSLDFGSTDQQQMHLLIKQKIRNACDKGLYACGAFLDFKKAFDTVNHDILLSKLAHYGISGQANNWFHSYLTQGVQFTSVNRFNS